MLKRTFLRAGAATCGIALWPSWASAQKHTFSNPITVGLPLQAGSASDIAVRYVTSALSVRMDVSFVVENITGAGGLVGLDRMARAKPDGQTLAALNNSILTILPHLQPQNVKVDTLTEFEPIAGIANIPTFFAVSTQSSIKNIDDLIFDKLVKSQTAFITPRVVSAALSTSRAKCSMPMQTSSLFTSLTAAPAKPPWPWPRAKCKPCPWPYL